MILDERIEKASTICILGHEHPDGDCMGATLSIYGYIKNKYPDKKVTPYLDDFQKKYLIMPYADKISSSLNDATKYDLCIVVDSGNLDRFKKTVRYFNEAKDTIVIDHHKENSVPAKVSIVDDTSIATCEILYDQFDKKYIDDNVAACLFVGISTDSGGFRYTTVSKRTFRVCSELIDYKFDHTKLIDTIMYENTLSQRKAQSYVFDKIKLIAGGKISIASMTDEEMQKFGITKLEIDNMIVYVRDITGVKIAAFVYETGYNIFKVSLRSKDEKYDVAEFARLHEGGGHKMASGCIYHGDLNKVMANLEKDLKDFLCKE